MSVIETATVPLAQQQADALLNVKDLRVTFSTPVELMALIWRNRKDSNLRPFG